jgi:hypothetical protein
VFKRQVQNDNSSYKCERCLLSRTNSKRIFQPVTLSYSRHTLIKCKMDYELKTIRDNSEYLPLRLFSNSSHFIASIDICVLSTVSYTFEPLFMDTILLYTIGCVYIKMHRLEILNISHRYNWSVFDILMFGSCVIISKSTYE